MSKSFNDKEVRRYIEAFADGELDVEQNLRVLEHMAMHPTATRRVLHQQQLRQAVGRVMGAEAGAAPADLVAQVRQLADDVPAATPAPDESRRWNWDVIARISAWVPVAAAAILLAFTLAIPRFHDYGASFADHIPTAKVGEFARRHVTCSRQVVELYEVANFPSRIEEVPTAVAEYLGTQPYPVLDLSKLGLTFVGVGKCTVPGDRAVHLVYRSKPGTGRLDTVSLWIQPDDGKFNHLAQNMAYRPRDQRSSSNAHPMVFWRSAGMLYYIVGDDSATVEQASEMLRKS